MVQRTLHHKAKSRKGTQENGPGLSLVPPKRQVARYGSKMSAPSPASGTTRAPRVSASSSLCPGQIQSHGGGGLHSPSGQGEAPGIHNEEDGATVSVQNGAQSREGRVDAAAMDDRDRSELNRVRKLRAVQLQQRGELVTEGLGVMVTGPPLSRGKAS